MKEVTLESKMLFHLALNNCHLLKTQYTIIGEGLLNNRIFYSETKTKKRGFYKFGKSETFYYFEDTPEGEEFNAITDLLKSIGLELKTKEDNKCKHGLIENGYCRNRRIGKVDCNNCTYKP